MNNGHCGQGVSVSWTCGEKNHTDLHRSKGGLFFMPFYSKWSGVTQSED